MKLATSILDQAFTSGTADMYAEAEEEQRKLLEMQTRMLGGDHMDTLLTVSLVGVCLSGQRKYAEAAVLQQEVLAKQRATLGPQHAEIQATMSLLATCLLRQGQHAEAEAMYQEVLTARRQMLGEEHTDTLTTGSNLACVLSVQGKHSEAEEMQGAVLAVRRRVLGPEHPDTLNTASNMACFLFEQGKTAEADEMHRELLAMQRRAQLAQQGHAGAHRPALGPHAQEEASQERFWAVFIGRLTIFVYAAATRVPFAVTAVYASQGLGLGQFASVGSLVAFSVGRAVSASFLDGKLRRRGQAMLLKVFPSLTTLGYLLLAFLLPAVQDLDVSPTAITAMYWGISLLTGLSETIAALDYFLKTEVAGLPLSSCVCVFVCVSE